MLGIASSLCSLRSLRSLARCARPTVLKQTLHALVEKPESKTSMKMCCFYKCFRAPRPPWSNLGSTWPSWPSGGNSFEVFSLVFSCCCGCSPLGVLGATFGASWGRFGSFWGRLGARFVPFWCVLGASWGVLGPSWPPKATPRETKKPYFSLVFLRFSCLCVSCGRSSLNIAFLTVLAPSLGRLGACLGRLGAFWGRLGGILGRLGGVLGRLGRVLGN